jgi:hypothetical protein
MYRKMYREGGRTFIPDDGCEPEDPATTLRKQLATMTEERNRWKTLAESFESERNLAKHAQAVAEHERDWLVEMVEGLEADRRHAVITSNDLTCMLQDENHTRLVAEHERDVERGKLEQVRKWFRDWAIQSWIPYKAQEAFGAVFNLTQKAPDENGRPE